MNEMRKLMEAVEQLDEYLVREGESIETLLRLNVFGDMGFGDDSELFSDDPDNGVEMSEEWANVIYDNQPEAEERYLQIKGEAESGRKLTNAEAQAAENTWYDGSDAYQSEPEAVEHLPGVYANQLNTVENILHGLVDDEWEGDYAPFDEDAVEEGTGDTDNPCAWCHSETPKTLDVDHNEICDDCYKSDDEVDEGKWDYQKKDKGKGAGTDSPMHDGGAKNRKSRKAFRKAEKAKAHQARMRGETTEQLNEVSDFDGESLDALVAQFEETCKKFRIGSFPRKQKDLLNVVMTRAKDTQDLDDLGHENALGNDSSPNFGGWPDEQR